MMIKLSHCIIWFLKQAHMQKVMIEDDDLLEKYNAIWNKVSADIKKRI